MQEKRMYDSKVLKWCVKIIANTYYSQRNHFFFVFSSIDNNYQESACEEVLALMRECCRKYKSQSICCEGIDIETTTEKPTTAKK